MRNRLYVHIRIALALAVAAALWVPAIVQAQETIKIGWLSSLSGAFSTAAIS